MLVLVIVVLICNPNPSLVDRVRNMQPNMKLATMPQFAVLYKRIIRHWLYVPHRNKI